MQVRNAWKRNVFLFLIKINNMLRTRHTRTCIWRRCGQCGRCGVSWHRWDTASENIGYLEVKFYDEALIMITEGLKMAIFCRPANLGCKLQARNNQRALMSWAPISSSECYSCTSAHWSVTLHCFYDSGRIEYTSPISLLVALNFYIFFQLVCVAECGISKTCNLRNCFCRKHMLNYVYFANEILWKMLRPLSPSVYGGNGGPLQYGCSDLMLSEDLLSCVKRI